ncbi:MAG TPA: hypothetical protein VGI80_10370, partial [Pyrinomonadaceae bacterium]
FILPIWGAISLIYLELTITTAVAIVFSSFSTPALSALLTFFIFLIGHFSASLRELAENLGSGSAIIFFNAIYYLLPNLAHFGFIANSASGETTPLGLIGYCALYAVVFDAVLLGIAVLIFSRRNFK